ncbi:PREDICTED: TMV resistance protein N-like [Nicotiana attenuata]|uniref:TMV resistance protein N-like n=1 Tax=Nicotiana attenuata TaxID=49451 RepID=UPI0009059C25|nr:PREDICTED: TMV resistance protein N-like [Nicotiana attenuata]
MGTMSRGEKAVIYVKSQYYTESPLMPVVEGVDEVHFEVELVHFVQVDAVYLDYSKGGVDQEMDDEDDEELDLEMNFTNFSVVKGGCDDDVRVIGIHGMGGMGKTTLARAVFDQVFHHFEESRYLDDVRSEACRGHNGLVQLQEQLLRKILRKKINVYNVDEGITLIKERLCQKKVFIVLDDLDDQCQLNALLGRRDWLRSGSRVVITTRDKHLLKELQTDEQYEAMRLDHKSSLQLFTSHAFRGALPPEYYSELVESIVTYCNGVPLALEILGVYLHGRNIEVWLSTSEKLKTPPPNDILTKLKTSFDGFPDEFTKAVFLDIACFHPKIKKNEAISISKACGFYPEVEICELFDRSLLKIDENEQLSMHNLIRDMGRKIVRMASPDNPGARSRLWCPNDISDVLIRHKKPLSCPMKYIPSDFYLENIVLLDMAYSNFEEFRAPLKYFKCLKKLIFRYCENLKMSPKFAGLHLLEELSFSGCLNLMGLDSTIGDLERLCSLN